MIPKRLSAPSSGRLLRFCAVGLAVTLLHAVIAGGLIETGRAGPAAANGIAFVAAALTSFALNARYTFRRAANVRRLRRFLAVSILCGFMSMGLAGACEWLGWPYQAGILAVVACVTPISFLLHRVWTYV